MRLISLLAFVFFSAVCPFCDKAVLEKQQYYEGDLVRVIVNYKPLLTGHSLIFPKRHVERLEDLTEAEFVEIGQTIKKVQKAFQEVYGTSDFLLVLQNGENAGQTVFHTHFHMIPRVKKNNFTKVWLWWMMFKRSFDFWMPVDWPELEKQRELLKAAISSSPGPQACAC